jgi:hypothetical protein
MSRMTSGPPSRACDGWLKSKMMFTNPVFGRVFLFSGPSVYWMSRILWDPTIQHKWRNSSKNASFVSVRNK